MVIAPPTIAAGMKSYREVFCLTLIDFFRQLLKNAGFQIDRVINFNPPLLIWRDDAQTASDQSHLSLNTKSQLTLQT